jgi:hypothetical protein
MRKNKLRWLEHVMRQEKTKIVRVVMKINFKGKLRRGRPKKKWLNTIKNNRRDIGVSVGDLKNRDE